MTWDTTWPVFLLRFFPKRDSPPDSTVFDDMVVVGLQLRVPRESWHIPSIEIENIWDLSKHQMTIQSRVQRWPVRRVSRNWSDWDTLPHLVQQWKRIPNRYLSHSVCPPLIRFLELLQRPHLNKTVTCPLTTCALFLHVNHTVEEKKDKSSLDLSGWRTRNFGSPWPETNLSEGLLTLSVFF